jgi:hypothetical protein
VTKKTNQIMKLKYIIPGVCLSLALHSCKKADFVELNTNPETLYDIPAQNQFLNATISTHNTDFEWYYDNLRRIMPWMQLSTANGGNGKTYIEDAGNFNQRYGNFYGNVGNRLYDVQKLIEKLPEAEQAKRVYMGAIPNILQAYYAFYVSDINGSIPFTEAFQARYGGTLTPTYDKQEDLFNTLDALLKSTIATLKSTPTAPQESLDKYDLYYKGDVQQWIKAANALRLKMAMRLMKRNPQKMATIVGEVLGSPASDLMSSDADSWVFDGLASFAGGGNFNPDGFRAPRSSVEFMKQTSDPRIRFFYQKNKWGQYVGSFSSPDAADQTINPQNARLYTTADTLSNLQYRLFQPSFNGGTGIVYFPLITFADFAFMRAELAARGVTAESAATWYNTGVTASLKQYDKWARDAKIQERNANNVYVDNYVALTDAEIAAYLARPEVAYNPAKGVELIAVQAYLNFFKQPNEAWALYKRTGYPNPTSVLSFERIFADNVEQFIPRRAPVVVKPPTDLNYQNNKAALEQMASDPDFGSGPSDVFGRVWWDKK